MITEPIKPIEVPPKSGGNKMNSAIENLNSTKKRVTRGILNYTGVFVGVLIVFIVTVVFTTDIKLTSAKQVIELSLAFFVLLFCSYSMFISLSDTGIRSGRASEAYTKALQEYDEVKATIIDGKKQGRLTEFCRWYVADELKSTRFSAVSEVGIDFELYSNEYIGKSEEELKVYPLSKSQIKAIIRANKIVPIKLTPEMIFKRGRGSDRRAPLGVKPEIKKGIGYGAKFLKTCFVSVLTSAIVLDAVITPTWATFASYILKLCTVMLNGFTGYKFGYENIVYDTVDYVNDQIDLMHRFEQYIEDNPSSTVIGEVTSMNEIYA